MNTDPKEPLEDKDDLPFDFEESKATIDDWNEDEDNDDWEEDDDDEWEDEEVENRNTEDFKHYVADKRMDAERDDRMIKD